MEIRQSCALHQSIVVFVEEGFDLIVDEVLPYGRPERTVDAIPIFGRYPLCGVGVHCALNVPENRSKRGQMIYQGGYANGMQICVLEGCRIWG